MTTRKKLDKIARSLDELCEIDSSPVFLEAQNRFKDKIMDTLPKKRGRPIGSGSYQNPDEALFSEMAERVYGSQPLAMYASAMSLVDEGKVAGDGTPASKADRLARRFSSVAERYRHRHERKYYPGPENSKLPSDSFNKLIVAEFRTSNAFREHIEKIGKEQLAMKNMLKYLSESRNVSPMASMMIREIDKASKKWRL